MTLKHCKPMLKRAIARAGTPLLATLLLSSMSILAQAQDEGRALINAAIAQDAVMEILPDIPEKVGLSPEDYISGNDHTADTRRVTVRIGPDGHVIPSADWQKYHPAQCRKQARETSAAAQHLTFEMQRITESQDGLTRHQYFAAVRLVDAESGLVKKKADGESTVGRAATGGDGLMENPDSEGVPEALNDAMGKLGVNIGTPNDGCGEIRLVHQFGAVVDDEFGFVAGYQNESGPNVTYEWDFGDGSATGSGDQVGRHVYTQKGTYTVTVHVGGEGVRAGSANINVVVKEKEEDEPIQPRDGSWSISLTDSDIQDCPPKIAAGVKASMTNMMGKKNRENLNFKTPFHPDPLMKHAKTLSWKQTGTNTWKTVVAEKGSKGISIKVVLEAEVVSPTLIKEVLDQHITMSGPIAKLMGGSGACHATSDYDVRLEQ